MPFGCCQRHRSYVEQSAIYKNEKPFYSHILKVMVLCVDGPQDSVAIEELSS